MLLRKYATGTGADVYIPVVKASSARYAVSADWTPAAGDVKISKDGAAAANIGTLPTAVTMGNTAMWKFVFTDSELTAKTIAVSVADSATIAVEDQFIIIETYGHASALHPFDLGTALASQTVGTVNAVASGGITAASVATDAIDADALADGAITAATFAAGAIDATAIAADAIGSSELAGSAVTEIAAGITVPTAAQVADAVWDESTTGHTTSGTFGEQAKTDIDAILAAVDTEVAGIVTSLATIAGYLDTEVAAILAAVDTEVAAIKAKTDNLPAAPAATGDIPTAAQVRDAILAGTIDELASVPAASPTLEQALGFLFMALRNKVTTTSTQRKIHNDAGTAIATASVSDDGTTATKDEYA